MTKSLAEMSPGEAGPVVSILAGFGLQARLDSLGIYIGKRLRKASAQWFGGPVVVLVDERQVALGFGAASKVLVNVDESGTE